MNRRPGDDQLPTPTAGVAVAALGEGLVAFTPDDAGLHVLDPIAAAVMHGCLAGASMADLVRGLAERSGAGVDAVGRDVAGCLVQLRDLRLVGASALRAGPTDVGPPATASTDDPAVHEARRVGVLDEVVVVRCDDIELAADIDRILAPLPTAAADAVATAAVVLTRSDEERWSVRGPGMDETGLTRVQALDLLPSALNQVAADSRRLLALHAGAVRHRSGAVVLLPAASGDGKSTLTAALVSEGWEYLTDEAAGVRAGSLHVVGYPKSLTLDASSRVVLGMARSSSPYASLAELGADASVADAPAGAVAHVVLPRFVAGAPTAFGRRLGIFEAVTAIGDHALNLRRSGDLGMAALADLAATVPCRRLTHGGVEGAVLQMESLVTT